MHSTAEALSRALARAMARSASNSSFDFWWLGPATVALVVLVAVYLLASRKRGWKVAGGVALLCSIFAFAITSTAQEGERSWVWSPVLHADASAAVRKSLVDPDSAKISILSVQWSTRGDGVACGTVNAKGRNGGYQGARPFAAQIRPTRRVLLRPDPAADTRPELSIALDEVSKSRSFGMACFCPQIAAQLSFCQPQTSASSVNGDADNLVIQKWLARAKEAAAKRCPHTRYYETKYGPALLNSDGIYVGEEFSIPLEQALDAKPICSN